MEKVQPQLKQLRRLDDEVKKNKEKREGWLRQQGWKHSSSYPGALWLWSKDFPESEVQWVWRGKEKVPHAPFSINGAPTEIAISIEAAWLDVWVRKTA